MPEIPKEMFEPLKAEHPYVSACSNCKYLKEYGTHGSFEYCGKEYPSTIKNPPGGLSLERRLIGCHLFEIQGGPFLTEETYKIIMGHEGYKDSILRKISKKVLVGE